MENKFTTIDGKEVALEKATSSGTPHLGSYTVKGDYVIAPAIIKELLSVKKYKKTTFKNSVFCTSFLPVYGELTFEVVYEKNSVNSSALATIYLLENEYKVNGYLQNTIKTKIGEYIGDLEGFIEASYVKFNISILPVGESKNYKVSDDEKLQGYIVARQQFNNLLERISKEECDKIYEDYFTKRLEILNSLGSSFSKAVLDKFKSEYSKIEKYFLKEKDYRALSELLDKCIEDFSGTKLEYKDQEEEFQKKILPILTLFIREMEKANEKATKKAKNMLGRKDKEKIEDIVKQEESATPSKSNVGVDKSPLTALIKATNSKVMTPRGTSSKVKLDSLLDRLNNITENFKLVDGFEKTINKTPKAPTKEKTEDKTAFDELREHITNEDEQVPNVNNLGSDVKILDDKDFEGGNNNVLEELKKEEGSEKSSKKEEYFKNEVGEKTQTFERSEKLTTNLVETPETAISNEFSFDDFTK